MDKVKQLTIARFCGFADDHELVAPLLEEIGEEAEKLDPSTIRKDDLFSLTESGASFFAHKPTWDHIEKLARLLRKNGESLTGQDLVTIKIEGNKRAVDFAQECDCKAKAFKPSLWYGMASEFDDAWFDEMGGMSSDFNEYLATKRKIASAEGKTIREDRLKEIGLTREDLRNALKKGDFAEIRKKFEENWDHLRASDVLLPDSFGDHMLDAREPWEHFEALVAELNRHDEHFGVDDFLHKIADRDSVLDYALRFSMARKIFQAPVWKGRTAEMMELYNHLNDSQKSTLSIEGTLQELIEEDYKHSIQITETLEKNDLTAIVNGDGAQDNEHFFPVRPLSLESVWEKIDEIHEILTRKQDPITLEDLRLVGGVKNESCMLAATRHGHFDKVLTILKANGERPSVEDLTAKNKDGKNILDILADRNEIKVLADSGLWAGHPAEFVAVWEAMPEDGKRQIEFQEAISEINLVSWRSAVSNKYPELNFPG